MEPRRFVYILRSDTHPDRHYVGLTSDVAGRLHWHNTGPSGVTLHHRPWSLVVSLEFTDAKIAGRFERYLKTGSGRAFAKRHFGATETRAAWPPTSSKSRQAKSVSP
jgi:putative endonuclease